MAGVLSAQSGSHPRDEENSGAFSSTVEQQLVGAWQLVRLETVRPNGEIIYPFYGKHPQGLLIYDGSGMMSVQIVSDPRPQFPQQIRARLLLRLRRLIGPQLPTGTMLISERGRWTKKPERSLITSSNLFIQESGVRMEFAN